MVAFLVLDASVKIDVALRIRTELEPWILDGNVVYKKYNKNDGIQRLSVNINSTELMKYPNGNVCHISVSVNAFNYYGKDGKVDYKGIEQYLDNMMSDIGIHSLEWRIVYFTFVTTIKTDYVDKYMDFIDRTGAPKGKAETMECKPGWVKYENGSRKLVIDGVTHDDRLRLLLSIKNRKINGIKQSDSYDFEDKLLTNMTNEIVDELEQLLWIEYLSKILGDSDYYSLNEAEKILKEKCEKISDRHKLESILKGISVYKGQKGYLKHITDKETPYDFMQEISSKSTAEKFIRELESKYHINPLIISRREAVDLSIKKLPGLASLVNYAVYDSSKKSPKDEEIYPTFDYN